MRTICAPRRDAVDNLVAIIAFDQDEHVRPINRATGLGEKFKQTRCGFDPRCHRECGDGIEWGDVVFVSRQIRQRPLGPDEVHRARRVAKKSAASSALASSSGAASWASSSPSSGAESMSSASKAGNIRSSVCAAASCRSSGKACRRARAWACVFPSRPRPCGKAKRFGAITPFSPPASPHRP